MIILHSCGRFLGVLFRSWPLYHRTVDHNGPNCDAYCQWAFCIEALRFPTGSSYTTKSCVALCIVLVKWGFHVCFESVEMSRYLTLLKAALRVSPAYFCRSLLPLFLVKETRVVWKGVQSNVPTSVFYHIQPFLKQFHYNNVESVPNFHSNVISATHDRIFLNIKCVNRSFITTHFSSWG